MERSTKQKLIKSLSVAFVLMAAGGTVLAINSLTANEVESPFSGIYNGTMTAFAETGAEGTESTEGAETATQVSNLVLKNMISVNNDYMLLATSIDNVTEYKSLGYYITTNGTTEKKEGTDYYTGIRVNTNTAELTHTYYMSDIYGEKYSYENAGMIVCEISYSATASYIVKPYLVKNDGTEVCGTEGHKFSFAFAKEEQELASGTHDLITVTTSYTGSERITYTLSKADGSTCYSKINGNEMRLFEGEHLLVASMTVNGIKYTATTTINVTPAPVTDNATIEDFDNPSSLDNTAQRVSWNPIPLTFVGDYSGHTGVMKFDLTNLKDNPGFIIGQPIGSANWSEAYDGNDYIAFDLKVEGTIPNGVAICWNPPTGGTRWVNFENTNEWQTLYIPLSSFDFLTSKQVKVFFGGVPEGGSFGIAVYIDRIYASARPATAANTIEDFDHPVSMSNLADHKMPVEYLDSFKGKTGILKLDLTKEEAEYPKFQIGAPIGTVNNNNFKEGYIAIDMYVEGTIPQGAIIGNVYDNKLYYQDGALVNGWHTYYLSLEKLQFLRYNVVEACFAKSNAGAFGINVYIDRIYASARPAPAANTIEDFDHPASMSNLADHKMPVEYLDSFKGKTGILKLDLTKEEAEYPKFQIGAPIGTVNKNNFKEGYIAIDMYVEGTIPKGAIIGNVYNGSLYWQDGALVNGWHTYYLSLEKLQFLNYNVVEARFAKSIAGAFGINVYIDRIYAVTQAEKDAATNP